MSPSVRRIWDRIAARLGDEERHLVVPALLGGAALLLEELGIAADRRSAAVQLAAILISPLGEKPGALLPELTEEIEKQRRGLMGAGRPSS